LEQVQLAAESGNATSRAAIAAQEHAMEQLWRTAESANPYIARDHRRPRPFPPCDPPGRLLSSCLLVLLYLGGSSATTTTLGPTLHQGRRWLRWRQLQQQWRQYQYQQQQQQQQQQPRRRVP